MAKYEIQISRNLPQIIMHKNQRTWYSNLVLTIIFNSLVYNY